MLRSGQSAESDYFLHNDGRFEIRHYNEKKAFSNFLPGIAGLFGTPMWVFTVNRGQGVASFGTRNKDGAILEFFPANKAYQMVTSSGFRTFLKNTSQEGVIYEPFRETASPGRQKILQTMDVSSHELTLREVNPELGLEINVTYFTVPGEPIAALAREVAVTNISKRSTRWEMLDGLPQINPYGMNEFFIKNMSRTIEAWMTVENVNPKNTPYFHLRVDATDRPEVTVINEGNFFFSLLADNKKPRILDAIVDPAVIFGAVLDFSYPERFAANKSYEVPADQMKENKTPCGFSFSRFDLAAGATRRVQSFYGNAKSVEDLNRYVAKAKRPGYFAEKREENRRLIEQIKSPCFSMTASPAYDLYCGQTYLDNALRGGIPIHLGDPKKGSAFYVYSRKHGDLERDYNAFVVEPTYFSQGNGNYRDVNQNRRMDTWFDPNVRDTNIKTFLNLIQADGFNPLVTRGTVYNFKRSDAARKVLIKFLGAKNARIFEGFLENPFGPGECYRFLDKHVSMRPGQFTNFLKDLLPHLEREDRADHGEGFWVDHWIYNLDLIENYLAIYPEDWKALLFERSEYTFYDNDHLVRPRAEKYVLDKERVRQFGSVYKNNEKAELLKKRTKDRNVVRTRHGHGAIYRTTLFVKLLCLVTNKFASLDPEGIGIEMEADKPSWYDALNGLPGLLGSSFGETFELKRFLLFLIQSMDELPPAQEKITVPSELAEFIGAIFTALERFFKDKGASKNYDIWSRVHDVKEKYRASVAMGFSGKETVMSAASVKRFLEHVREKVEIGIEKGFDPKSRMYPTYFENRIVRHRRLSEKDGKVFTKALEFKQSPLPYFLEGPVHAMKVEKDPAARRALYRAVRDSRLYDKKLGMYKVTEPLESASLEVGRARIFTPGWLENESIWLHMEYKWMLEVLKAGMADEFYDDFKKALVPFQKPERYGRSILENSSFIVSSVFQDASLHGTGFVARLSGSTAEFLNMWLVMNVGKRPFALTNDKKLSLRFDPTLPAFLFTKEKSTRIAMGFDGKETAITIEADSIAFMFLGKTLVVYHNPRRLDTFGGRRASVRKITLESKGQRMEFRGDTVPSPYAERVRQGLIRRIDIELG